MKVVMTTPARRDELKAANWYRKERFGLDIRFRRDLIACVEKIAIRPEQFPIVKQPFRRARLEVFPYQVVFEIKQDHIRIVAVAHDSREPLFWINRI